MRKITLLVFFVIMSLLFTRHVWSAPSTLSLEGGFEHNIVGQTSALTFRVPKLNQSELSIINKVVVTIDPSMLKNDTNSYTQIADMSGLKGVSLRFFPTNGESSRLIEGTDYSTLSQSAYVTAAKDQDNTDLRYFTLISKDVMNSDGSLEFKYDSLMLLTKGFVQVTVNLYKDSNDTEPYKSYTANFTVIDGAKKITLTTTPSPIILNANNKILLRSNSNPVTEEITQGKDIFKDFVSLINDTAKKIMP